jgi:hypothetical protein
MRRSTFALFEDLCPRPPGPFLGIHAKEIQRRIDAAEASDKGGNRQRRWRHIVTC